MIALLPEEMIIKSNDDLIMDFKVNSELPVTVNIKSFHNNHSKTVFLQGKYFIVTATVDYYHEKKLSFVNSLDSVTIPEPENRFSLLAKSRWEIENKKKNMTSVINSAKHDRKFQEISFNNVVIVDIPQTEKDNVNLANHKKNNVDACTQTNISGIITDYHEMKWKLNASKSLSLTIIWSFLENCFTNKRSYNDDVYNISQLLYLSSAKTYNLSRNFLPFPSYQKLYIKFGDDIKSEKKNLIEISMVDEVIQTYKHENHINDDLFITVTLAIDAFAFKSFSTRALTSYTNSNTNAKLIEEIKTFNNGFIFMMIPTDFRFPPIILHIEKESSGFYNDNIERIANFIKICLICNGFKVWFKATDGDKYPSQDHTNFFKKYVENKANNFLDLIYDVFENLIDNIDMTIPTGDPLHLWKNLRSRYQIHSISLFEDSPLSTNYEQTKSILEIGNALEDETSIGKMRDIYSVKFFTFENVIKLLCSGQFIDATFIFPIACWVIANYSIQIDLQFRLFLIELSFQMLSVFHEHFIGLKKKKIYQKSSEKVTFHEEQYLIRMQNTLIATAIALLFSSQFVRVDGVGTHLVENSIGIARQSANDPRWQRIITAFSHANIRKKIAKKYNIKLHVQGRINDGGAKVDEKSEAEKVSEDLISKPSDWSITRIIELFHAICVPEMRDAFQGELQCFIVELKNLGPLFEMRDCDINPTANNGILARLISFKIDPAMK